MQKKLTKYSNTHNWLGDVDEPIMEVEEELLTTETALIKGAVLLVKEVSSKVPVKRLKNKEKKLITPSSHIGSFELTSQGAIQDQGESSRADKACQEPDEESGEQKKHCRWLMSLGPGLELIPSCPGLHTDNNVSEQDKRLAWKQVCSPRREVLHIEDEAVQEDVTDHESSHTEHEEATVQKVGRLVSISPALDSTASEEEGGNRGASTTGASDSEVENQLIETVKGGAVRGLTKPTPQYSRLGKILTPFYGPMRDMVT